MPITPDTKDWTWVLQRPCPDCGFHASQATLDTIPGLILQNATSWIEVLRRPDVRQRPDDSTWSPLEYAAHVRDVHRVFADRLHQMLTQADPLFPNWDQDSTAVEERYAEQAPSIVLVELVEAATSSAQAFADVRPDQVERTGRRSDGSSFTVLTLAQYYAHDPVHHLWDVSHG